MKALFTKSQAVEIANKIVTNRLDEAVEENEIEIYKSMKISASAFDDDSELDVYCDEHSVPRFELDDIINVIDGIYEYEEATKF